MTPIRPEPPGPTVRVSPAPSRSLGPVARLAGAVTGRVTGVGPLRVITTLGRHRRLFRRWLPLSSGLLRGDLPADDRELVILRTAWRCGSWYEWVQHVTQAGRAGLDDDDIERVVAGPGAEGWSPRRAVLLAATDELLDGRVVTDRTWRSLSSQLDERALIELCFLVGHYEMVAMTLNSLGVEPEPAALARLAGPAALAAGRLRDGLAAARRDPGDR
jgi:alkylhydroperoxidase family enzyme